MKPVLKDPSTGRLLDSVEIIDRTTGASLGSASADQALAGLMCGNYTLDTDLWDELPWSPAIGTLAGPSEPPVSISTTDKIPTKGLFAFLPVWRASSIT